jgi:biotin carboxyl carrier protein
MQYQAIINGETVEVEFERTASGIEATVGGRKYSLEASTVRPGIFLLNWGSRSIEVSVLPTDDISSVFTVSVEGRRIPVEILDGRRMLERKTRSSDRGGASEVRSPMPGKIVRVLMAEGAGVVVGQGVVVMEAMKMQNEIKSSTAGRIQKIAVVEGETVRSGDLIAIVEAISGPDSLKPL